MKFTSRIIVLNGRELQVQFSDDGEFELLDPLQYASVVIPANRPPAAFRIIDITEANPDVVTFLRPIGSESCGPVFPSRTDDPELPDILSISREP